MTNNKREKAIQVLHKQNDVISLLNKIYNIYEDKVKEASAMWKSE